MSGSFDDRNGLEIEDGKILFFVGKKKSGKSILAKYMFAQFPFDKVVIDVAGDDGPAGGEVIDLHGDVTSLPKRWPEELRDYDEAGHPLPMTLRYVPDPGSDTFERDCDAVIGMALAHGKRVMRSGKGVGILIHEIGLVAPSTGRKYPHVKRLLNQNRHNHATLFACGPRTINVDPLLLAQADVVYVFELPNDDDRQNLAGQIGWRTQDLSDAIEGLGRHEYLRFDANELKPLEDDPEDHDPRLVPFLPLPPEEAAKVRKLG